MSIPASSHGMDPTNEGDLDFTFRAAKGGNVTIFRRGKSVTILRGGAARNFLAEVVDATLVDQQQLMARITGNYKRGNERLAASHPRNRKSGGQ
jgi:hypothetical protein